MICDDREGIRESLKVIISDHYDIVLTNDGFQCLDALAHAKDIGAVLLDIKMPIRDGLDVLKEIKQRYPHVKIIMITGYESTDTATEAIRCGAAGYIVKPFKAEEVLATVKEVVG